jgi:hypothetical protein
MNPLLIELLNQQRASGYPDVAGAHASATIPVSEGLVTTLIQQQLPATVPIRELDVRAHAGNRFTVRVRLSRPAFVPPISLNLLIEQQPQFPDRPVLGLRVLSGGGLFSLAGVAIQFLNVLPAGCQMDGDRVAIDLRTLAEQRGMGELLDFVEHLEVSAEPGKFVISFRGVVPAAERHHEATR